MICLQWSVKDWSQTVILNRPKRYESVNQYRDYAVVPPPKGGVNRHCSTRLILVSDH